MIKRTERLSRIYSMMKQRCYNSKMPNFKSYGARGIAVCDEWRNDSQSFYEWAILNGYKEELTLDRIDNSGNYEPSNCRWVTAKEQSNHRSNNIILSFNGENHTISEWSEITGIKQHVIRNRLIRGWSIENVLTRKVGKYVHKD